jgi:hypothetical protein
VRSSFLVIARLATPALALGILSTVGLIAVLPAFGADRSLAVDAWLLAIGGLAVWSCWRVLASALPVARASAFDEARHRAPEPATRLPDVLMIESILLDAEWTGGNVELGLRPLLRRVASALLFERHMIDLETEPEAAERLLGPELWALVGPGIYAVPERTRGWPGHGIPRETIERIIDRLEAV